MIPQKFCYVIVVDVEETKKDRIGPTCDHPRSSVPFWYTRPVLQSVLQLVGCKTHHAFKISRRVFKILECENLQSTLSFEMERIPVADIDALTFTSRKYFEDARKSRSQLIENMGENYSPENNDELFDLYKKQAAVTVSRERFLDVTCSSLEQYRYVGPSQRADIDLACRVRERKESVTILLCGTSGCGKSTLSSLLASRLGITTVVSTDSIRHMMRSFIDEKENPLLWASTYHAGEFLDPNAVAAAKKRRKDIKLSSLLGNSQSGFEDSAGPEMKHGSPTNRQCAEGSFSVENYVMSPSAEPVGSKILAVEGYKAQSEMVIGSLDKLITAWEERKESVVVEGVHLSLNFVMTLMKKHPSIMPFLIYIANEEKHLERFAIRAKYMTLDPSKNKYVKYIKNIRTIQDYLCNRADKHLVPKVNNTNVDQSVASIHSTIFSCLRRRQMGVRLYDPSTKTVQVLHEEYCKQCDANSISSKGMFRMIQRQDSIRRYMAIVNSDGSVAKAWPFSPVEKTGELAYSNGDKSTVGSPIYGPLQIREAEPVNVQFGNYGIGSWPNDAEGTSYMNSVDSLKVLRDDDATRYSSSSSSPLHSEGHAKELKEEVEVSESEEEPDHDEEDDSSDTNKEFRDELEGSVVESSARSDDEYDGLTREASGLPTDLCDGFHSELKVPKPCSRTLSMTPSRKPVREGRLFSRLKSLPLQRSHSNKLKRVNTLRFSSDA